MFIHVTISHWLTILITLTVCDWQTTLSSPTSNRQPSYCDRILYKKLDYPNNDLEITEATYEPKFQYTMSDHRPITALFYIKA